mgnify:FL=1
MAQYQRDVVINVTRPSKPLVYGDFTKVLYLTNEIDKPIKRYSTLEEVATDYTKLSKMYKSMEIALSQTDFDGNGIRPDYWFCGGFVNTAGSTTEIEAFFEDMEESGFYGIVLPFYEQKMSEWLALYLNRVAKFAIVVAPDENAVTDKLKSSDRILFMYENKTDGPLDLFGLTAHTFWQGPAGRWKDRRIVGVSSSIPNNVTLESTLLEKGINATVDKAKYVGVTNGSWCADGITHADQRIKIDSIVHDLHVNLQRLLIQEKNLFMDTRGISKVEATIDRVMIQKGKELILAVDNNGNYLYKITVPSIEDTNPNTGLTTDDFISRTLRNTIVKFTISTEIETINVTLVWHDEPITSGGN